MLDRSLINKTYPPIEFDVEKQRVKFFSKATGQTDPIYFDETIAREKGFPSILAPPTFLTTVGYEQEDSYQYLMTFESKSPYLKKNESSGARVFEIRFS